MEIKCEIPKKHYTTCGNFAVCFLNDGTASVTNCGAEIIKQLRLYNNDTNEPFCLDGYADPEVTHSNAKVDEGNAFYRFHNETTLCFRADYKPDVTVYCGVNDKEVLLEVKSELPLVWSGNVYWGEDMQNDTFSVDLTEDAPTLRAAVGPATDSFSHALLDRKTGRILNFGTENKVDLCFAYDNGCYKVQSIGTKIELNLINDFYQNKYGVNYRPISKNATIKGAPAGFCTYYVWNFKFDQTDFYEAIDAQEEKLKRFGANCVLLDLEWVREDIAQNKNFPGDHFNPDLRRFPSGMKAVAQKIKSAGFVPQLWYGVTNEAHITDEIAKHPDIVFTDENDKSWPGCYFLDPTHPYVKETYLPRFFAQIKEWGYDALKWDLLGETETALEKYHDRLYDPSKSSDQIMRETLEIMRKELGDEIFVCQCAAPRKHQIRIGADIFNSMRIGGDLWDWNDFSANMLYKLCSHYPLHNVMLYCDPDNLILGEDRLKIEFDKDEKISLDEAFSRVVPVTLLGQTFMIGEDLRTLADDRLELLRQGLPVADVHPLKLGYTKREPIMLTVVQISKPFDSWTVFSCVNTTNEKIVKQIDIQNDLGLKNGEYLVYDYRNKVLLNQNKNEFSVEIEPRHTGLYAVHKRKDTPQIVSSSRHLLQGAVELENAVWIDNTLTVSCKTVKDYPYAVSIFVPDGFKPQGDALKLKNHVANLGGSEYILNVPGLDDEIFNINIPFIKA